MSARVVDADTDAFAASRDSDEVRRLAIERLWTVAGHLTEPLRKAAELPPGVDPWAELYGFRSVLAHALPATSPLIASGRRRS
ncbi:MAG TPA: hypothetical protein VM324_15355 [Egibacteraceae bacterium]|jgi:hypothetical protein|nr:hypothetical protein [Egibacteraceae bacterium]